MAVPALAGLPGSTGPFQYIGHVPVYYLDYLDVLTQETLAVVPGGSYTMTPVNSRAGLTVPPPDNCWLTATNRFAPRLILHHAVMLAAARTHAATVQAATSLAAAAAPAARHSRGTAVTERPQGPPSEAALTLAAARARNAHMQALRARGEVPVGG
jgi:hypothetical protein